jgi:hypothetical protein
MPSVHFVDFTLYPIELLLLQVVQCENDRDKINYCEQRQQISHQHPPVFD